MKKGDTLTVYASPQNLRNDSFAIQGELIELVSDYGNIQSWFVKIPIFKVEALMYIKPKENFYRNKFGVDFRNIKQGLILDNTKLLNHFELPENTSFLIRNIDYDKEVIYLSSINSEVFLRTNGKKLELVGKRISIEVSHEYFKFFTPALISKFNSKYKSLVK